MSRRRRQASCARRRDRGEFHAFSSTKQRVRGGESSCPLRVARALPISRGRAAYPHCDGHHFFRHELTENERWMNNLRDTFFDAREPAARAFRPILRMATSSQQNEKK